MNVSLYFYFGTGLSGTPLGMPKDNRVLHMSSKVDTVKSFTVVDEAAIHVLVVFNMFLTDQPHVHDLCGVYCQAKCNNENCRDRMLEITHTQVV